jgi:hypothetical protein
LINNRSRFKKLLRLSEDKTRCLKSIRAVSLEQERLPKTVAEKFESGFGIDFNLVNFVKQQFSLDLSKHPNVEDIILELKTGNYSDENPLLELENGDLIIDQICSFTSTSELIRKAFNVPLEIPLSESELLPCSEISMDIERFFSPVYDEEGDAIDNMYMQIDMQAPLLSITKDNGIFTNVFTSSINDIRITVFKDDNAIGIISGNTITCDKSAFAANERIMKVPSRFRNSVLLSDAALHSEELERALEIVTKESQKISGRKGLSVSNSLASEFMISSMSTSRQSIFNIAFVDFDEDQKNILHTVLDSIREVYDSPENFHLDAYSEKCDGYNPLIWHTLHDDPDVIDKKTEISNRLKMSGISVFVANHSYDWWYDSLSNYKPCDIDSEVETKVIMGKCAPIQEMEHKASLTDLGSSIDDLLFGASVADDKECEDITMH